MASPNMSSVGSGSASAGASIGSEGTHTTDIKAPLWDHVTILEKPKTGGGNALWRCKYCPMQKLSSYTRVEAHLLQKGRQGIGKCPNVTYEMLSDMRKEIERCKDLVERSKTKTVYLVKATYTRFIFYYTIYKIYILLYYYIILVYLVKATYVPTEGYRINFLKSTECKI